MLASVLLSFIPTKLVNREEKGRVDFRITEFMSS